MWAQDEKDTLAWETEWRRAKQIETEQTKFVGANNRIFIIENKTLLYSLMEGDNISLSPSLSIGSFFRKQFFKWRK